MANNARKLNVKIKKNPAAKDGILGRILNGGQIQLYANPSEFKLKLATKPQ